MATNKAQQIELELDNLQKELARFLSLVDYLNSAKDLVEKAVVSVNKSENHFSKKIEELKDTYVAFVNLKSSISDIVSKIDTINFPERLDKIEVSVKETVEHLNLTRQSTLQELSKASEIISKVDFEGKFKKLQITIDESVKSNKDVARTIENQKFSEKLDLFQKMLTKNIDNSLSILNNNLKKSIDANIKSITDLNLPLRIESLNNNISSISTAIQNVQGRLDNLERNLSDKIKDSSEKHINTLDKLQNNFMQKISFFSSELVLLRKKQKISTLITWLLIVIGFISVIIVIKI